MTHQTLTISLQIVTSTMDDDWFDDSSAPKQGGSADPLTSKEYDRIAARYSDVSLWAHSAPTHQFSVKADPRRRGTERA